MIRRSVRRSAGPSGGRQRTDLLPGPSLPPGQLPGRSRGAATRQPGLARVEALADPGRGRGGRLLMGDIAEGRGARPGVWRRAVGRDPAGIILPTLDSRRPPRGSVRGRRSSPEGVRRGGPRGRPAGTSAAGHTAKWPRSGAEHLAPSRWKVGRASTPGQGLRRAGPARLPRSHCTQSRWSHPDQAPESAAGPRHLGRRVGDFQRNPGGSG